MATALLARRTHAWRLTRRLATAPPPKPTPNVASNVAKPVLEHAARGTRPPPDRAAQPAAERRGGGSTALLLALATGGALAYWKRDDITAFAVARGWLKRDQRDHAPPTNAAGKEQPSDLQNPEPRPATPPTDLPGHEAHEVAKNDERPVESVRELEHEAEKHPPSDARPPAEPRSEQTIPHNDAAQLPIAETSAEPAERAPALNEQRPLAEQTHPEQPPPEALPGIDNAAPNIDAVRSAARELADKWDAEERASEPEHEPVLAIPKLADESETQKLREDLKENIHTPFVLQRFDNTVQQLQGILETKLLQERTKLQERVVADFRELEKQLRHDSNEALEKEKKSLYQKMEVMHNMELQRLELEHQKEVDERISTIKALERQVHDLERAYGWQNSFLMRNFKAARVNFSLVDIEHRIAEGLPIGAEWKALQGVAEQNGLVDVVVRSLSAQDEPVASLAELKRQFRQVERCARAKTLVREDSTLLGVVFAKAVNRLLFTEHILVEGSGDRERLMRAGAFLDQGSLREAVLELDALSARTKPGVEAWLTSAKRRVLTLQAVAVLKAEATLLPHHQQ